ncbi:hypothetical protein [Sphingomonas sp.]
MPGLIALFAAYLAFWLTHVSFTLPWATLFALGVATVVYPLAERIVGKSH